MSLLLAKLIICNIFYSTNAQTFRNDYLWAESFKTFYRLNDIATDWGQARKICEAEGSTLLIPSSLTEVENLKLLISNMKAHFTAIFIGVHDQFAHGEYVTVKGYPIKDTILELLWAEGSPDNLNNNESCVVMTREGLLDDRPCDDIYPFVCKVFGNETEYSEDCYSFDLGQSLEEAGYASWSPLKQDLTTDEPQHCGAISRTGFLKVTWCDMPAMFLCEKPGSQTFRNDYMWAQAFKTFYRLHDLATNWAQARQICEAEGTNLLVPHSLEEMDNLKLLISNMKAHFTAIFIGVHDQFAHGEYVTLQGQSLDEAGYSSWSPIKQDLSTTEPQHCGAISRSGFLKVTWCDMPAMFLCEKRGCQECTANLTTPAPAP
ncbi:hypothetical protein MSG28_010921 [Choristoneura fumiferana]|uniref:Uncharacterized protein n=1 Tax=Choristoneura fumiferana TaxID=7141 RepID=A0ACC0KPA6_CHOFU|nr:hypothetical protein MSG28_010921 [Choristoneura fumiferana]